VCKIPRHATYDLKPLTHQLGLAQQVPCCNRKAERCMLTAPSNLLRRYIWAGCENEHHPRGGAPLRD
jgi:hypothetical protein